MYFFKTIIGFLFCTVVLGCNYTDNIDHLSYYTPEYDLPGLDELLVLSSVSYRVEVGKIQAEWKIPDTYPSLDKLRVMYAIRLKQCHVFSMYLQCSHAYYATIYISRVITTIREVENSKENSEFIDNAKELIKISEIVTRTISKLLAILIHLNYVPPQWVVLMLLYSKVIKEKLHVTKDLDEYLKNWEEKQMQTSLSPKSSQQNTNEKNLNSSIYQDMDLKDSEINEEEISEDNTPGPMQLKQKYLWNLTQYARSITQNFINGCSTKLGIQFSNAMKVINVKKGLVKKFTIINKSLKDYYNHVVKPQKGRTIKRVTYNTLWSFRSVILESKTFAILTASEDKKTLGINWKDLKERFQEIFQTSDDQTSPLLDSYMSIWNANNGASTSIKEVFRTVVLRYVYVNTIYCDNMYENVNIVNNSGEFKLWLQTQCKKIKESVVAAIKYLGNDLFLKNLIPALNNFIINPMSEASNIIITVGRQLNQQSGLLNVVATNEVKPLNVEENINDFERFFKNQTNSLQNAINYIKDVKHAFKLLDFKILDTIQKSAMNDWIQSADPA
ncbi:Hypothetical protein CINCED_3A020674 [Cinara cedri]|uniref:Uncharacterized protein n=1 Tax=Cinara cedri TaxID=506608 RepID=A0A5E4N2Y2_9HEMI|nr:Hypothetical protein CINCED_3A020674 [Cinara cedri]